MVPSVNSTHERIYIIHSDVSRHVVSSMITGGSNPRRAACSSDCINYLIKFETEVNLGMLLTEKSEKQPNKVSKRLTQIRSTSAVFTVGLQSLLLSNLVKPEIRW